MSKGSGTAWLGLIDNSSRGITTASQAKLNKAVAAAFAELHGVGDQEIYLQLVGAVQAQLIHLALYHSGGNQSHAAIALGLSRTTVHKLMLSHRVGV